MTRQLAGHGNGSPTPHRVVIVGYGMAGARLAEELRHRDPDGGRVAVTVVGAERQHAYNRVLLSSVLAGSMTADQVLLHEPDWAARHAVDLRRGVRAVGLDRARRRIVLADGDAVDYDTAVLATGSRPWLPPVDGLATAPDGPADAAGRSAPGGPAPGVLLFRTLADCRRIVAATPRRQPVAVLGGGLLGLEAARGLAGRGNPVTVVHPVGHLMERQLDPPAGNVLARTLATLGVRFRLGVAATGYRPGAGLALSDGSFLPTDVVVVAAGTRAETALAADSGLAVDTGVLVDDLLRTADPRVCAIGDCAQHPGTVAGLVQSAWEQAAVLADRLTGAAPAARYLGTPVVTRLKAAGVDLAALGESHLGVDCADAEVLRVEDPRRGRYAKLVLRGDRVTGAIVLGVPDAAATITHLYQRGVPAPADRLALLLGRALPAAAAATNPARMPAPATVCRCNSVTKAHLVDAFLAGHRTVDQLATATRAGTGCGSCRDVVAGIAEWLADTDPEPSAALDAPSRIAREAP